MAITISVKPDKTVEVRGACRCFINAVSSVTSEKKWQAKEGILIYNPSGFYDSTRKDFVRIQQAVRNFEANEVPPTRTLSFWWKQHRAGYCK